MTIIPSTIHLDSTGPLSDLCTPSAHSARYLIRRGVSPSRVLLERWSLDTIGNAAFARLFHSDLLGWRRLLVITSEVHMARTSAIFDWIFSLPPHHSLAPILLYEAVPELGLSEEQRASRRTKEEASLHSFREGPAKRVRSLAELHPFLFQKHSAYAPQPEQTQRSSTVDAALLKTY